MVQASTQMTLELCGNLKLEAHDTYNINLISQLIGFSKCLRKISKVDEALAVKE